MVGVGFGASGAFLGATGAFGSTGLLGADFGAVGALGATGLAFSVFGATGFGSIFGSIFLVQRPFQSECRDNIKAITTAEVITQFDFGANTKIEIFIYSFDFV